NTIIKYRTIQQLVDRTQEARLVPGIPDVDLTKSAIKTPEMVDSENRALPQKLEYFIDRITTLETAIFDAEDALVRCSPTAIEEKNVVHKVPSAECRVPSRKPPGTGHSALMFRRPSPLPRAGHPPPFA